VNILLVDNLQAAELHQDAFADQQVCTPPGPDQLAAAMTAM
jgi:hypothetical protein